MKTIHSLFLILLFSSLGMQAQKGKQKKADRLFEDFAYLEATEVYKELIENDYNTTYNSKKLGDSYMLLRSPENAVHYYGDIIEDTTISREYYYKYAQALRGVKRYDESREWLKKYLESGNNSDEIKNMLEKEDYKSQTTYKLNNSDFNTELSDFGAFVKDNLLYFVSARAENTHVKNKTYNWNGEPFLDIYVLDRTSGDIRPISGTINTKLHDGPAVVSPDGTRLYFTRNNYLEKEGKKDSNNTNNLKIYSATRSQTGDAWENVKELHFNSNEYSVGHPSLAPDGKTLYFTSDMPGGIGGTDIYKISIAENGEMGIPENLGEPVNTEFDETFPFMDEDETLYFSSNGHPGLGLFDIFRVTEDGKVENLGEPINSNMDDFAYFQVTDSKEGYISSNRGNKGDDIYEFNKMEALLLKGTVSDAVNGNPIPQATVRIMDQDNNQIAFLTTDEDGNYQTEIKRDLSFPVEAKEIEYETYQGTINTSNTDDKEELVFDIQLDPVKDVEYLAEINNIYFDFDKSNIRPDAAKELDKLVDLMQNEYPELVIEIGSHTDKRGSDAYNERLAERRAQSTYKYLVDHGIDANRIVEYKGFGEKKPAVACDRCSEKEHQLNRRSMFSVVKMNR